MQNSLRFALVGLLLLTPFAAGLPAQAGAATTAELQVQAQALLAQVIALQAQYSGSSAVAATGACPNLTRSLSRGISGNDVLRLQTFLARDSSIYPEAVLSGYFGPLTERAVQRWQVRYGVISSGSGYGIAGPRTAAAIALQCAGGYGGILPPATVGGFISVSPIQGAAPLTVNVTATVNTPNSCAAAVYVLDFGDGTTAQQIPIAAGMCAPFNQTYPHVYRYGGTYKVTLSAGGHSESATVVVTGAPPPVFTSNIPTESFNASPTSGTVPLAVTFSGIVNSNDAGFCVGGCASTLDFGDGMGSNVNLPAAVGGWLNYSVTHTYTQSGGYRATLYQGGAGVAQPTVGTATIIANPAPPPPAVSAYSYSPPNLLPPTDESLTFGVQFDLPAACTGYTLSWGDGSSTVVQSDGGSSCTSQAPLVKTLNHTYAAASNYTVVLKRGASLARSDNLGVTIQ
ncbi:MAG: peptidoglycan-binding protein [bacterium]|nr:peptidoglycan-binding protein [bacterium]